ncbi:MAG: cyclic nucleotide-binding domain-containing protein [Deltaproteobacteria bacterium]|nr:cyclic nucleotide-binding domain-containing protein [Deltaproteobacteria bacterium]
MWSAPRPPEATAAEVEQRAQHLRAVSLFAEIAANQAALLEFASIMVERNFKPGVNMITEGEGSNEMFILVSGTASVFKTTPEGEPFRVAILKEGQHAFFGEGGLIYAERRSATITSDTECHCLVLSRSEFEKFGDKHPDWALPFYRRISASVLTRLRKANEDMMILYKALVSEIRGH